MKLKMTISTIAPGTYLLRIVDGRNVITAMLLIKIYLEFCCVV